MSNYRITIPNDKTATYKVVTFIMALINVFVSAFFFLYAGDKIKNLALLSLIINSTAILMYLLYHYTKYLQSFRIEIAFIISALIWLLLGKFLLALMLIIFAIAGFYTNRKFIIRFSHEGILYPSFPKKILMWADVEQVLLKDDVLTIDMKDNRLMQFAIDKENTESIDETAFNDFCSRELK